MIEKRLKKSKTLKNQNEVNMDLMIEMILADAHGVDDRKSNEKKLATCVGESLEDIIENVFIVKAKQQIIKEKKDDPPKGKIGKLAAKI